MRFVRALFILPLLSMNLLAAGFEYGDVGLVRSSQSHSKATAKIAAQRIIQRLSKSTYQNVPRAYQILNASEKKALVLLLLSTASGKNNLKVANVCSRLVELPEAISILDSRGIIQDPNAKEAAGRMLARIAEDRGGELELARLAIRDDIAESYSSIVVKRVSEILQGVSGHLSKFSQLGTEEKQKLAHQILRFSTEADHLEIARSILNLDHDGDMEGILRKYDGNALGLKISAEAIISMKTLGRSEIYSDNMLVKLTQDESPYVRNLAVQKVRKRISASAQLSPVFRLLDRSSKERLARAIVESTVNAGDELDKTLQKLSPTKLSNLKVASATNESIR